MVPGAGGHSQIRPRHHARRQSRRGRPACTHRTGVAHDTPRAAAIPVDHGDGPGRRRAVLRRRRDHPGNFGAQRGRGTEDSNPVLRALCDPDLARSPGRPVPGAAARHGGGRRPVWPGDAGLVRGPGAARPVGDRTAAAHSAGAQPDVRHRRADRGAVARLPDAGRGVSRGDRGRDALCRYGAFRPPRPAPRLALAGLPSAGAELFRAGRVALQRPGGTREPVLQAGSRMGSLPARDFRPQPRRSSPRKR